MNQELTAVIPLESDPAVFDKFARALGLNPVVNFIDIFSIEDDTLLGFIQRPVVAIILLFPVQASSNGVSQVDVTASVGESPVWLKQNFKNACGLYAMLHILINNKHLLTEDSILLKYCLENKDINLNDNLNQFIIEFIKSHTEDFINHSGSSENPNPDDLIDLHYITYISYCNTLWELDGRSKQGKAFCLGEVSSPDNKNNEYPDLINEPLVKERITSYMNSVENENDKMNFSLLGLSKSWD